MSRKDNVRREGYLMEHYINAHERGDTSGKVKIQKEIDRNVAQRRHLGR